jgi:hypothetical protein
MQQQKKSLKRIKKRAADIHIFNVRYY